jgi:type I restriction enzyme S subunit
MDEIMEDDINQLTHKIIGLAMQVHRVLGNGFQEVIYQRSLAIEMQLAGSVARCCSVPKNVLPARVNQHVMIIRPDSQLNISFYILLNLCSTDSKNTLLGISQSGSTREAITKAEIEEFEIIVPDSGMLKKFEGQIKGIFSYKDLKSLENQKLTELKNLLLSKLATIAN